jgi:WD40 repeat protein
MTRATIRFRVGGLLAVLVLALAAGPAAPQAKAKKTLTVLGEEKAELREQMNFAIASPDGKTLATSGDHVYLWEFGDGKLTQKAQIACRGFNAHGLAFSPDSTKLALGCTDHKVRIWDVAAAPPKELHDLGEHVRGVEAVAWSPDGLTLASGSSDRNVILWSMLGNKPAQKSLIKIEDIRDPTGKRVLSFGSDVRALQWSVNSKALTVGCANQTIRIYDVTGKPGVPFVYKTRTDNGFPLVYSIDGKTLAIGGDKNIELWATKPVALLSGHTERVRSLSFASDGRHLMSASDDGRVVAWDLAARKPIELREKPGRFTAVACVPTPGVKPADAKEMLLAACHSSGQILLLKLGFKE